MIETDFGRKSFWIFLILEISHIILFYNVHISSGIVRGAPPPEESGRGGAAPPLAPGPKVGNTTISLKSGLKRVKRGSKFENFPPLDPIPRSLGPSGRDSWSAPPLAKRSGYAPTCNPYLSISWLWTRCAWSWL